MKAMFRSAFILTVLFGLFACASQETPRDVTSISTSNIKALTTPKIVKADNERLSIRYAQMSMGFDPGCNPGRTFSDTLNECAKLPKSVKDMALDYCDNQARKAVFLGNTTNFLQMTVSNFRCE
jgi:hypothetical protein